MKSLTKRTLLFILFISIPSTLNAAKSNKLNEESHSQSNTVIDTQNMATTQKSIKKDIEDVSQNSSNPSESSRKSQKMITKKTVQSMESRSAPSNNQMMEETSLAQKSSLKSSPKHQPNESMRSPTQKSTKDIDSHVSSEVSHDQSRSPAIKIETTNKSHLKSEVTSHTSEDIQHLTTPVLKTSNKKSEINLSQNTQSNLSDNNTPSETNSQHSHHSPISKSKKSLDNGRDSIDKSRSRYERVGENEEEHICKKNLMSIFSVEGNQLDQAIKATPREKAYCRRNGYTCCSAFNIMSINKYFGKGRKKLRQKFEILEELLALFRGPKFVEYVQERKDLKKCTPLVADMKLDIKGQSFGFFDLAFLRYQLEMAENLLMDTEIYVKKILWFYGDSICSICSPKVQDYFDFSDETPKINVHINTCSERIEEREFERNLLLLYERFISKTMEFIQCTQGVEKEEDGDEPDSSSKNGDDEGHKDEFLPIDEEEKETFLETFDKCWQDQSVSDPTCQGFCKKNMRQYSFPINNLFHNFKVSLKIMYEAMTGGNEIEEYYENIKESQWDIEDENEPIDFYPLSEDWAKYKMDDIEWEFHTSSGHNVFKEIMSKKFTEYEESVSRLATVALIAFFALFN
jgi:hypothetical protein